MYETEPWADGTRELWRAIAEAPGYTVIGGGDTISAAAKFSELSKYGYVCTGGGAMVRFLAGKSYPSSRLWRKRSREILANAVDRKKHHETNGEIRRAVSGKDRNAATLAAGCTTILCKSRGANVGHF